MTAQVHERLILDGVSTSMAFCPPLPEHHPRIVAADEEAARASIPIVFSTACWRGYIGTWEIKDNKFYLVGLEGQLRLLGPEPLLADWFTGVLRVPRGEMLHYVHMGFGSVFEEEVHIRVDRGLVVESRVVDNRGKQYDEWTLTTNNLPGNENRFPGDEEPFSSRRSKKNTKH